MKLYVFFGTSTNARRLRRKWLVGRRKGQADEVETQTSGKTLAALSLLVETFAFQNLNFSLNVLLKGTENGSEQNVLNV